MSDSIPKEESLKRVGDIYALLSNLSANHPSTLKDFESFREAFANKIAESSLDSYKEEQKEALSSLEQKVAYFQAYHLSLADSFNKMSDAFWIMQTALEGQKLNHEALLETTSALRDKILRTSDELYACLHENDRRNKEQILAKIDQLPIPKDTVSPSQMDDAMTKKIEPTKLDAKNALLTAKNHELRLSILEKKIENALLQLKNMELNNA